MTNLSGSFALELLRQQQETGATPEDLANQTGIPVERIRNRLTVAARHAQAHPGAGLTTAIELPDHPPDGI